MWRDKLRPARFRGAAFFVDQHSAEIAGRRVAVHQYPGRDRPLAEDLGRKAQEFSVDAYVVGDDYMAARDALVDACNQAGSGELVHPYLGSRSVMCTGCRLSESTGEGRLARLQLAFVEAGDQEFPASTPNTAANVEKAAIAAKAATEASFASSFSVRGLPQFVADGAAGIVSGMARELASLAGVQVTPGILSSIARLAADAANLVRDPAALATEIPPAIAGVSQSLADLSDGIAVARGLTTFGATLPAVPGITATRLRQAANQSAIANLVQRSAIVEAVRLVPGVSLAGRQDAIGLRDLLADDLDQVIDTASTEHNDPVYDAFGGLRTALVRHLNARAPALAEVVSVVPPATEPALVAAYRLYGDAGREAELVTRNGLRHPGFVPGGRSLEALADA